MIPDKKHYSAAELAAMKLPGMPQTSKGIRNKARTEQWPAVWKKSRGLTGQCELYCPPANVLKLIREKQTQTLLAEAAASIQYNTDMLNTEHQSELTRLRGQVDSLNLLASQVACANARCAILAYVTNLATYVGRAAAIEQVVQAARDGTLPPALQAQVSVANARNSDGRTLSRTRLYEWLALYNKTFKPAERILMLAPGVTQKDMSIPAWGVLFLKLFRRPNQPKVTEAHKALSLELGEQTPSLDQVRRFMRKLAPEVLYRGRMTGAALKAVQPYTKRDTRNLKPNDVWMGDGHGFKALVAHPDHGQGFRPEVTLIIDAASRLIVGWSASLSESCIAVCDALRHAMTHHPVCCIYYSDNGGGQTNKTLDAPVTGVLGRLGVAHELGRPGNPQGRGMVERLHQTVLIKLANQLGTSQTSRMDRDTLRITSRNLQGGQQALANGRTPSEEQQRALNQLPTWTEFLEGVTAAIADYNANHEHRALPKVNGRHMTPQQFYDLHVERDTGLKLDADDLRDMFRPTVVRRAKRGLVSVFNNGYFHRDLMLVDGEDVQVGFDIHDAQHVQVRTLDGRYVCEAEFNGNARDMFAKDYVDRMRDQRAQGREKRLQRQLDEVRAEQRGTFQLEASDVLDITREIIDARPERPLELATGLVATARQTLAELRAEVDQPRIDSFELPTDMESRYRLWLRLDARMQAGDGLNEREMNFWRSFAHTTDFAVQKQMFEEFGLAAEG